MQKNIAVVTGASGGLGKAFVGLMANEPLDEIWCVARNTQKLEKLKAAYGDRIIPLSCDLSERESVANIKDHLEREQPHIAYLINNAGVGETWGSSAEMPPDKIYETIQVNCGAVAALCSICVPYMRAGDRILNLSSQSAFQPVPYINLYAATKVFVRSYTRALNVELKGLGITATAVCPGWVDTDMLTKTRNGVTIQYPGLAPPKPVAAKALSDAKKNKDMSVYTGYVKFMHFLSKVYPQRLLMKMWVRSIQKYNK